MRPSSLDEIEGKLSVPVKGQKQVSSQRKIQVFHLGSKAKIVILILSAHLTVVISSNCFFEI
jgi:hypothetical protein